MRFSSLVLAAAAFSGFVSADVFFTNIVFNNVTAGEPFTLTWANATGPVEIKLKNGGALNLQDVQTVTTGQTGQSFTWNVPASLPADTYAFEISDGGSKPNYSARFQLIGGATTSASVTSTANSTSTSTGSSSTITGASNNTATHTSTHTDTATRTSTTSTGSSSPTSAPNSGNNASGLAANLAFVFLTIGALMTLN